MSPDGWLTYKDAKAYCRDKGTRLTSIESKAKYNAIHKYVDTFYKETKRGTVGPGAELSVWVDNLFSPLVSAMKYVLHLTGQLRNNFFSCTVFLNVLSNLKPRL